MKDSDLTHWAEVNGLLKTGKSIEDSVKRKDVLEIFYRLLHNTVYEVSEEDYDGTNYTDYIEGVK